MPVDPYVNFFMGTAPTAVLLETLEISHPDLSKTYYVVRNSSLPVVAEGRTYEPYPVKLEASSLGDNLDYQLKITLGDIGEASGELENLAAGDGFGTRPMIIYRAYNSDDLTSPVQTAVLEASQMVYNEEGVMFTAEARRLNRAGTGETYTLARFPALRGFL